MAKKATSKEVDDVSREIMNIGFAAALDEFAEIMETTAKVMRERAKALKDPPCDPPQSNPQKPRRRNRK